MKCRLMGIYKITCTVNGRVYVGSSINVIERKCQHFSLLRKGSHPSKFLQNSFNKYQEENFEFELIEGVIDKSILESREQFWIDEINPKFNLRRIAKSNAGYIHSDETKAKWKKLRAGKTSPTSFKSGMTPWNKNVKTGPLRDDVKKRISLKLSCRTVTHSHRLAIAKALTNKSKSESHRKNISKNRMGIRSPKSKSKHIGVAWISKLSKWRVRKRENGKRIYIGTFENEIDAIKAYESR